MKELVIPLRLDSDKAMSELRRLGEQGKESGGAVAEGMDKADQSMGNMFADMLKVNVAMEAMSIGGQMLDAVSQGAIKACEDLKRMALEFINLRDRARELAGVLGKPANIQFTKEQVQFAAETGFGDPQKAVDFRTAFQSQASQYVGRFRSEEEYKKFEKEAARIGNQYNVAPHIMAELAGMVVRTGPMQGQTSEEATRALGGAFKTMMVGSGGITELAGQLARMSGLVGEGRAFRNVAEAATATRMAAETNLPEAYTWQTEMRQGVIELATGKKRGSEDIARRLGITADTTNFEAIKALSEDQAKHPEKNLDLYLREIFPMKRISDAFRDSITAYRRGVMERGLKDAAAVKPGQMEGETAEYFKDPTQPGMLEVEKAKTKAKEAELATDKATIAPYMERAHTELLELEESPAMQSYMNLIDNRVMRWFRGSHQQGYQGYEQLETAKAMGIIRQEAKAAGVDVGQEPSMVGASQSQVEAYMAELVRLTRERLEQAKKQVATAENAAKRPMPAPMPPPEPPGSR